MAVVRLQRAVLVLVGLLVLHGCGDSAADPPPVCTDQVCSILNTPGAAGNRWNLNVAPGNFGQYVSRIAFYPDGTGAFVNKAGLTPITFNWARAPGSTNYLLFANEGPRPFVYGTSGGVPLYGTLDSMTITGGAVATGTINFRVNCSPVSACSSVVVTYGTLGLGAP